MSRRWQVVLEAGNDRDYDDPVGMVPGRPNLDESAHTSNQHRMQVAELKTKKAWELGKSPLQGILPNLLMLWMVGSTLNVMSVMMMYVPLSSALKGIFSLNTVFKPYSGPNTKIVLPKLMFITVHFATLLLCIWKINTLGLFPTTASDWIAYLPFKEPHDVTFGGSVLGSSL
ncbi:ER membrane protein complex subunit 4 [Pelomyxa schiedti]|nr:ER membrane protein complex subunit 4 [Pelomyxa schiedti]